MTGAHRPRIVIATQSVEGNPPALRLLKICAEFGDVTVITQHKGPDSAGGVGFRRIIPRREWLCRGLRALCRHAGKLLPARVREKWIRGYTEEALGLLHQGRCFKKTWKAHALRPELLVLDGAEYMTTALSLARRTGAALVYYVHEMFPNQRAHYSAALTAWMCRLEREGCRRASHVIVQHHLWGKLLRRRYRISAAKFIEVTPSPDPEVPLSASGSDGLLSLYYHGLYTPGRGLEVLIRGVALVPGVVLELRGIGDYEKELVKISRESGAEDRIRFLPPLDPEELPGSARGYDLGVMTGTNEHLNGRMAAGMKLYQNISAGIALFGYRAITVRNRVRIHGIGFAYDGRSPEKVAETLRECVQNRDRVTRARVRAAEVARSYFNSDMQYARLRQVIAAALASAPNTHP